MSAESCLNRRAGLLHLNIYLSSLIEGFYTTLSLPLLFVYLNDMRLELFEYAVVENLVSLAVLLNPFSAYLLDSQQPSVSTTKAIVIALHFLSFASAFAVTQLKRQGLGIAHLVVLHFSLELSRHHRCLCVERAALASCVEENGAGAVEEGEDRVFSRAFALKVIGKLLSSVAFGAFFSTYLLDYFYVYCALSLLGMILTLLLPQPQKSSAPPIRSFISNFKTFVQTVKRKKLTRPLCAFVVAKAAPSFSPGLKFFLIHFLGFSNIELSIKVIVGDFGNFIGVFAAEASVLRSGNERNLSFFYALSILENFVLMAILHRPWGLGASPFYWMVTYSALHQLLQEVKHYSTLKMLIRTTPEGCETFFLSMFGLIAHLSSGLSIMLGLRLIALLRISTEDFSRLPVLVGAHSLFYLGSLCILLQPKLPFPKRQPIAEDATSSTRYAPLPVMFSESGSLFANLD